MKVGNHSKASSGSHITKSSQPGAYTSRAANMSAQKAGAGTVAADTDSAARKAVASNITPYSDFRKELQTQYPGAVIDVSDLSGEQSLREYAQSHYSSLQIVLSPEALKRLETDVDFRKKCEELIAQTKKSLYEQAARISNSGRRVISVGMYIDEEGNVAEWTASKDKKQESGEYHPWLPSTSMSKDGSISRFQGKDGNKYIIKKTLSYRPSKDLGRLAKARNQQMVKSTMSSVRAAIYQLKSGGGDKKVAGQLVSQAEQVLLKAQLKVKQLKKEDLIESAQKKAEQQSEIKKAMHLRRMLEEKRVKRTVREHSQIRDHYPTPQEIKREEERAKDWVEHVVGVGADNTGMQTYMPTGNSSPSVDVSSGSGASGVFIDITL